MYICTFRPVGTKLFPSDGQAGMSRQIVAVRNSVKAPKNRGLEKINLP